MEIDTARPIMVTGANGYVASWLVKLLLEEGLNVHGAVRNPDDERKVGHLRRVAATTPGKLTLFKAELLAEGSYEAAMRDCELVFHTASPFIARGIKDARRELIEPALTGTRNVLETVDRVPSVKRVVLTSSVVSVYGDARDLAQTGADRFDESHWNFSSSETQQPYSYSKTLAEKAAWEIVGKQHRWDLVVINPGVVMGPSLTTQSQSESIAMLKDLGNGTMLFGAPQADWGIVDVRDVALGHRQAGLLPHAHGRHILVSDSLTFLEMGKILREHFGRGYLFPRTTAPKFLLWAVAPMLGLDRKFVENNVGFPLKFDNSYAKRDLGMEFRPVSQTIVEHFQQLLDEGTVKKWF